MRKRALVPILAVAVLAAACSSDDGPQLRSLDSGGGTESFQSVPVGASVVLPMPSLCTTGAPIRVTAVSAASPTGGMRVTSWGTHHQRPGPDDDYDSRGGIPGLVTHLRGFSTTSPVRSKCGDEHDPEVIDDLDVSVAASSPRATMRGVTVHYGAHRSVVVRFATAICSAASCALPG